MSERTCYFAYGSNLDTTQMAWRCPDAIPVGRVRLPGWRLIMNRYGLATIVPDPDATAWGGLWRITPRCERALDAYESIDTGLYVRRELEVLDDHDDAVTALVYLATESRPGRASTGYLDGITAGARDFALPQGYLRDVVAS